MPAQPLKILGVECQRNLKLLLLLQQILNFERSPVVKAFVKAKIPADQTLGIEFKTGVIRQYNPEKGYGYIARGKSEGDLFFHASRYSPVEFDRKELALRFAKVEWEKKQIKVKSRRFSGDGTDEEVVLSKLSQNRTIDAVKLEKIPKPGDQVLYTSSFHKMRESAEKWMFFQEIPSLRAQLSDAFYEATQDAESLQVFRIYRVHITKGPPVADNKRKEFVSSVIETKTLIFEGNDIDSFKWTLNSHKMSDVWESGEVKYLCAALINGEEFDAGFLLSTLGFSTCGFDESHILRTDQQNALVKFWENF